MRHPLRQHRLPAATRLRAGLHASVLALLAMFSMLVPHWPGETPSATTATLSAHASAGGEEAPAGEYAEQEAPAKLRRVTSLQAPRAAWNRPAPPQPAAPLADAMPAAVPAIVPAAPACPPATPMRWRLQRGQAPPLA